MFKLKLHLNTNTFRIFNNISNLGRNINPSLSILYNSNIKCSLVKRELEVSKENMLVGKFKAKHVSNEIELSNLKFTDWCIKRGFIYKSQKLYIQNIIKCNNLLLQHYVIMCQDPRDPNIWMYVVCTSKPFDISKLSEVFILKTIKVIRIGDTMYYLSSEEYNFSVDKTGLDNLLPNNNVIIPISDKERLKFMNGDIDLLPQYLNQAQHIFNNRINIWNNKDLKESLVDVNTFASKYIYKKGIFNSKVDNWEEQKWIEYKESCDLHFDEVKGLLAQCCVSVDESIF